MGWSKKKAGSVFWASTRRIWNILFWGTLFGLIVMAYNIVLMPTVYRSEASVYVSDAAAPQPGAIVGSAAAGSAAEISDNYAQSYIEVMTSEKAFKRVKKTLSSSMTPEMIGKTITVKQVGSSAVFTILVEYSDAQSAQMLAEAEAKAAVKTLDSVGVEASVLDSGSLPILPSSPHVLRNTLIAIAVGIILRWLIAVIAAAGDHTLQGREEWEAAFDIPVLAEIPERDDR